MRFNCTRDVVLLSGLVLSLSCHSAFAGEGWRIVDTAGDVTAGGAGFVPVALSNNQTLPADAWVETRATGRAVLARGLESIVVGPNSRVQLPDEEVNGNTQILQTMGSALYQIGKQQKPHFQVDTPYLAAVVKGTSFTVTVDGNNATVSVSEGLVEVSTPDRSDVEFVKPGFKATVSQDHRGEVVVEKGNDGPAQPANSEQTAESNSTSDTDADIERNLASDDSNDGSVVIVAAIGEVALDIKEVSDGLAYGEVSSTAIDDLKVKDKDKTKSEGDSVDQTEPVQIVATVDSTAPDLSSGGGTAMPLDSGSGGISTAPELGAIDTAPILDGGGNSYSFGQTKDKIKKIK